MEGSLGHISIFPKSMGKDLTPASMATCLGVREKLPRAHVWLLSCPDPLCLSVTEQAWQRVTRCLNLGNDSWGWLKLGDPPKGWFSFSFPFKKSTIGGPFQIICRGSLLTPPAKDISVFSVCPQQESRSKPKLNHQLRGTGLPDKQHSIFRV